MSIFPRSLALPGNANLEALPRGWVAPNQY